MQRGYKDNTEYREEDYRRDNQRENDRENEDDYREDEWRRGDDINRLPDINQEDFYDAEDDRSNLYSDPSGPGVDFLSELKLKVPRAEQYYSKRNNFQQLFGEKIRLEDDTELFKQTKFTLFKNSTSRIRSVEYKGVDIYKVINLKYGNKEVYVRETPYQRILREQFEARLKGAISSYQKSVQSHLQDDNDVILSQEEAEEVINTCFDDVQFEAQMETDRALGEDI